MIFSVIGSRKFSNRKLVFDTLAEFITADDRIVSGGARGVDTWADEFSQKIECEFLRIPAQWNRHGKRAGHLRNPLIIDAGHAVMAFWDGESGGTRGGLSYAHTLKRPILIVYPDGEHWASAAWHDRMECPTTSACKSH